MKRRRFSEGQIVRLLRQAGTAEQTVAASAVDAGSAAGTAASTAGRERIRKAADHHG